MARPAEAVQDAYIAEILRRLEELERRLRLLESKVVYIRRPDDPTRPASPYRPRVCEGAD